MCASMHCCSGKSALKETVSKQRAVKKKHYPVSVITKHAQSAPALLDVKDIQRDVYFPGWLLTFTYLPETDYCIDPL